MARRSRHAYINREGDIITSGEWTRLQQDKAYRTLAEFENDRFKVMAEWQGEILNAADIPREQWKPYALEVFVVQRSDIDGRELAEPKLVRDALGCDRFKTGDQAMEAAAAFLKRFAGVDDKALEEMKPLTDDVASKAEHIPTREEAAMALGSW